MVPWQVLGGSTRGPGPKEPEGEVEEGDFFCLESAAYFSITHTFIVHYMQTQTFILL